MSRSTNVRVSPSPQKATPTVGGLNESELASPSASGNLTPIVGANLRRVRRSRGLSLARLSEASSVSRAMLSQVELGKSTPTINVLWRIARALGISFSALLSDSREARSVVLRAGSSKVLTSHDGGLISRALFPTDGPRKVEFYELRLAPRASERAEAHPFGTRKTWSSREARSSWWSAEIATPSTLATRFSSQQMCPTSIATTSATMPSSTSW